MTKKGGLAPFPRQAAHQDGGALGLAGDGGEVDRFAGRMVAGACGAEADQAVLIFGDEADVAGAALQRIEPTISARPRSRLTRFSRSSKAIARGRRHRRIAVLGEDDLRVGAGKMAGDDRVHLRHHPLILLAAQRAMSPRA